MSSYPIGFFDSGIGGITIWESVNRLLPNENTIYLADSNNSPYGTKSYDKLINSLKNDQNVLKVFSDFMEKVMAKVLNNLNINLPFSRSEIIKKN